MGNLVFQATLGGQVNLVGPNTASTYNLNVPAVSSTIATTSGTETLTNKTLTNPVINGFTGDTSVVNIGSGQLYKDTSGNLGLGVTPSASTSNYRTLQIGSSGNSYSIFGQRVAGSSETFIGWNAYGGSNTTSYGSGFYYKNTGDLASLYTQNGLHAWFTAASGTAGSAITFTQAMTLDASGNLGVGTTSPATKLHVLNTSAGGGIRIDSGASNFSVLSLAANGTTKGLIGVATASSDIVTGSAAGDLVFRTASTNMRFSVDGGTSSAMSLDSSGNLLVGVTSATEHTIFKNVTSDAGQQMLNVSNCAGFRRVSNFTFSSANTAFVVGKDTGTNRSINAAGSINASGADYAEYMVKSGDFVISKGDVVGINAEGKLTNLFADSVSFAVKSTAPSYVGGDVWGSEEALGLTKPSDDATDEEKATFAAALEAARQTVDRIAFAGQVPVNVTGATAGQYIIPVNDNGSIKGEAVSNPTFEQYQIAVGKVIAIEQDGRAKIIVKVA